jgi:rubrerythrin
MAWSLDDIAWERFDGSKIDPELVKLIKAASLVESNGRDYATYLCNVFPDDPAFQAAANIWALEEEQHGEALARWAVMADTDFDYDAALARFRAGYRIPLDATRSVRGSRTGELVARCIVEVGTSSYYAALGEASQEPVLRQVCQKIAADELRHYKLFYTHLKRYLGRENIGRLRRLLIALGRMNESEDDELAYAFYAANATKDERYHLGRHSAAYLSRAAGYYRAKHVRRAVSMTLKAAGLKPPGRRAAVATPLACRYVKWRRGRLAAVSA